MHELLITNKEIELCTQTFGDSTKPIVILIYGAAGQGILWDINLSQNLAKEGYFVVRYDNRDTGKSSAIDYEVNPYNLIDMANDILSILDYFKKDSAHIVGSSMGGYIAQNFAILFPEKVKTLCLLMTTINSLPLRGIRGLCKLPGANAQLIKKLSELANYPRITLEDKINNLVQVWKLFNGDNSFFPEDDWLELAKESYARAKSKNAVKNHRLAVLNSDADRVKPMQSLNLPTLIMHGSEDLIIPFAHAEYANYYIKDSKLLNIKKMGHLLTSVFTNQVQDTLLDLFLKDAI